MFGFPPPSPPFAVIVRAPPIDTSLFEPSFPSWLPGDPDPPAPPTYTDNTSQPLGNAKLVFVCGDV